MSLEIFSFAVDVLSLLTSIYLAFVALQFSAKPKIKIMFKGERQTHRKHFQPGENVKLEFEFQNVGHWYAKPAALETIFYLNFSPQFKPSKARYGAEFERINEGVKIGKGGYKFIKVSGIYLFYGEPSESVLVETELPSEAGTYLIRVASMSSGGDHGVHNFQLQVLPRRRQSAQSWEQK